MFYMFAMHESDSSIKININNKIGTCCFAVINIYYQVKLIFIKKLITAPDKDI